MKPTRQRINKVTLTTRTCFEFARFAIAIKVLPSSSSSSRTTDESISKEISLRWFVVKRKVGGSGPRAATATTHYVSVFHYPWTGRISISFQCDRLLSLAADDVVQFPVFT